MSKNKSWLELIKEVLLKTEMPMTRIEIWDYINHHLREEGKYYGYTPWSTIAAKIYVDIKEKDNDSNFCIYSKRPTKFGLKELSNHYSLNEINRDATKKMVNEEKKFSEKDLHPILTIFANTQFFGYLKTKTINHSSSKQKTKGSNKWLHPDMIGVWLPFSKMENTVLDFQSNINQINLKLYSFEIKKDLNFANLRESYFQAVSNSSWANYGYLVTADLDDDEDLMEELMRLNERFGLGIIKLDKKEPQQSEIKVYAKFRNQIDWLTLNKMIKENNDCKLLFDTINKSLQIRDYHNVQFFDHILNEGQLDEYIKKHF